MKRLKRWLIERLRRIVDDVCPECGDFKLPRAEQCFDCTTR